MVCSWTKNVYNITKIVPWVPTEISLDIDLDLSFIILIISPWAYQINSCHNVFHDQHKRLVQIIIIHHMNKSFSSCSLHSNLNQINRRSWLLLILLSSIDQLLPNFLPCWGDLNSLCCFVLWSCNAVRSPESTTTILTNVFSPWSSEESEAVGISINIETVDEYTMKVRYQIWYASTFLG